MKNYSQSFKEAGYKYKSEPDEGSLDERMGQIIEADLESCASKHAELSEKRRDYYRLYRGRSTEKDRDGRSKFISRDLMAVIEWKLPQFVKYFTENNRMFTASPVGGPEDQELANIAGPLLDYQFFKGNNGLIKLYVNTKLSEIYGYSYIKSTWVEEYQEKPMRYAVMTQEEFDSIRESAGLDENDEPYDNPDFVPTTQLISYEKVEIAKEPDPAYMSQPDIAYPALSVYEYHDVVVKELIYTYRGPKLTICEQEDIFVDPLARDLDSARFVIHRSFKDTGELKMDEDSGIYKNIDEAVEKKGHRYSVSGVADSEKQERDADIDVSPKLASAENDDLQKARAMHEIYEYWGLVDVGNTGRYIPWLATVCNGVVIRSERNPYNHGKHPFDMIQPNIDPHQLEGIGQAEVIGDLQDAKTSILRQSLDNMSFQNNQMWEVVRGVHADLTMLLAPRPGGIVRVNKLGGIRQLTPAPLDANAYRVVEFIQTFLESWTGQTRYNQGMNSSSLNRTASGITQVLARSDMRNWLESVIMANGFLSMAKKWMSMNQQFLPEDYVFRIFNKQFSMKRDDIMGIYDIEIKIGNSMAEKQATVQQIMQLLQMSTQLMATKAMTPDDIYNLYKDLLETWGHTDLDKYSTDPQFTMQLESTMQQLKETLEALIQTGAIDQNTIATAMQQYKQGGGQGGQPQQSQGQMLQRPVGPQGPQRPRPLPNGQPPQDALLSGGSLRMNEPR